jgi:DNA-binding MarR family transcriptional regulator
MLTIEDCIALCGLTEEEIEAIAEHEHMPRILATEMAAYLVETPSGERRIRRMIREDIETAQSRGDHAHAAKLKLVLTHFIKEHRESLAAG